MRHFQLVEPSPVLDGVRLHLLQRYVLPWEGAFPAPSFLRGRKGFYLAIPSAHERFFGLEWSFQISPRYTQDLRSWLGFLREHLQNFSDVPFDSVTMPSLRLFGSFTFFPASSIAPRFGLPRLLWTEEEGKQWVMLYHWAQTAEDVLAKDCLRQCLLRYVASVLGNVRETHAWMSVSRQGKDSGTEIEGSLSADECAEAELSIERLGENLGYRDVFGEEYAGDQLAREGDWSRFALSRARWSTESGAIWDGGGREENDILMLHHRAIEQEAGRVGSVNAQNPKGENNAACADVSETEAGGKVWVQVFPLPGFEEWRGQILRLQEAMRRGEVRKVVLARTLRLVSTRAWNAEKTFQILLRTFPHAYPFFFRFDDQSAFFGVTPERLARVEDGILHTMALAGSLPRGATPEEDAQLTQKLLEDARLRLEHQIVVESIAQALQPLMCSLEFSDVQPLRLPNVQHLQVHIHGQLSEECDVLDAIQVLHPTAALGGQPRQAALQWIAYLEPFERGWYGAPLGWVDAEGNGDFLVALRCGWVRGREALLFAGAGILPQSDPHAEWEETALKFRPMLQALEGSLAWEHGTG